MPSRNTIPEPMIAATSVHRWVRVIAAVGTAAARRRSRLCSPACRDQSPSWGRASSCLRWPTSTPRCLPPPGVRGRGSPSSRPRPPDGTEVFHRWATQGSAHFSSLGAEVEPVLVRDRVDADDASHARAIGEADPSTCRGKPAYLVGAVFDRRRAAVGGPRTRRGDRRLLGRERWSSPRATGDAPRQADLARPLARRAGMFDGASVVPHYDAFPNVRRAPRDAGAARRGGPRARRGNWRSSAGQDGSWQVHGRARVTVWRGRRRERFRAGDVFRL